MRDLSVIIPVYNTSKYIDECIKSVLNQTIKNIEIILVDDESPDDAGDKCDKYAASFENISVIHKKNEGLGFARNSGLENAHGEYIAFLDSDDYVSPDYYERMLYYCKSKQLDICTSKGFYKFSDNGERQEFIYLDNEKIITKQDKMEIIPKLICRSIEKDDGIWGSSCFSVYKNTIFKENGIRFISERQFISEDLWFSMDAYESANRIGLVNVIGYNYRYNPESLSRKYNPNRFEALCKSIKMLEEKCDAMGLTDYQERIALYFFGVFEKCINQEIRFEGGRTGYTNYIKMCSSEITKKYLKKLSDNKAYKGSHALLCKMLKNKWFRCAWLTICVYNYRNH